MYPNEEDQLREYRNSIEQVPVPMDQLDDAILTGYHRASVEKRRLYNRRKWIYTFSIAVVLLLGFFSSIRLSPAFATYVSSLPGMEKIVALVANDKGMLAAIEQDYYQKMDVSEKHNGVEVTIDGAIADENALYLFYTLRTEEKVKNIEVDQVKLIPSDDKLHVDTFTYGTPHNSDDGATSFNGKLDFLFSGRFDAQPLELELTVKGEKYYFSIELDSAKIKAKKVYELNETVTIEGQNITIVRATVYPSRVAIHVKMDPKNTKKLFAFEDLRLVDEKGEAWSKIADGVTGNGISENETMIYLQSNYFREPKKLSLLFNRIQAVDKDEDSIVVDTSTMKILQQPSGNLLKEMNVVGSDVVFSLSVNKHFPYFIFGTVKDGDGQPIEINSSFSRGGIENGVQEIGITIPNLSQQKNPISLELNDFPQWIEGEAKIKIK